MDLMTKYHEIHNLVDHHFKGRPFTLYAKARMQHLFSTNKWIKLYWNYACPTVEEDKAILACIVAYLQDEMIIHPDFIEHYDHARLEEIIDPACRRLGLSRATAAS
jgi:hypothetical protein